MRTVSDQQKVINHAQIFEEQRRKYDTDLQSAGARKHLRIKRRGTKHTNNGVEEGSALGQYLGWTRYKETQRKDVRDKKRRC